MANHEAQTPTDAIELAADQIGEQVVTWPGIGWDGYDTVLEVRGERSRPKILYLDGDLTFVSRDYARIDGDQVVVLLGVGWAGYEKLLKLPSAGRPPRLLYLDEDVQLMAPSHIHEAWAERLGSFVRELVAELDIPCVPTRETVFKRGSDGGGVQPDDSFYFANRGPIIAKRRKANIDLEVDPPPDLAIEFIHTHGAGGAIEVLRRIGVPEVWIGDEHRLQILLRDQDGQYREAEQSLVFPFLTAAEVYTWVARTDLELHSDWTRALRQWIAEVLLPRVRPNRPHP